MRGEGLAIGEWPGETVVAMHGFGRKGVGAVQGHPALVAKAPKMGQYVLLFKAFKDLNTHRIKVARRDRIEPYADLMVTGNLLHAEQGLGVIGPFGMWQPRWYSNNDGDWVKKIPKAPRTASWTAYRVFGPS
jgi:hypothetical protein